jgi:hypothetical protein
MQEQQQQSLQNLVKPYDLIQIETKDKDYD